MRESRLLLFFLGCLLMSCEDKQAYDPSGISYKLFNLESQGWKSKKVTHFAGDIQYSATQVPIEYYLLKDQGKEDLEHIDSLAEKYSRERIIEVEFEHIDNEDLLGEEFTAMEYEKSVIYMSSSIQKDFSVYTASGDTIPCSGVLFERHFKVSPFKRVILYFGGIPKDETIQLIYQDRLFNNGIFKFKFNEIPFKT